MACLSSLPCPTEYEWVALCNAIYYAIAGRLTAKADGYRTLGHEWRNISVSTAKSHLERAAVVTKGGSMSIADQEYTTIAEATRKITDEWRSRFGEAGNAMADDADKIIELVLLHLEQIYLTREQVAEMIRLSVAPWALAGNEDPIPMEKIDKSGVIILVTNPDFITDGELMEIIKTRDEFRTRI